MRISIALSPKTVKSFPYAESVILQIVFLTLNDFLAIWHAIIFTSSSDVTAITVVDSSALDFFIDTG